MGESRGSARLLRRIGRGVSRTRPRRTPAAPPPAVADPDAVWFDAAVLSVRAHLARRPAASPLRTIAVLAPDAGPAVRNWLAALAHDQVDVLVPALPEDETDIGARVVEAPDLDAVHRHLLRSPPVDLILVLHPDDALPAGTGSQHELFVQLFFHLPPAGVYVLAQPRRDGNALGRVERQFLTAQAHKSAESTTRLQLRQGTGGITVTPEVVVVAKRTRHYALIRDEEATEVITSREPRVRVTELDSRPAGQTVSAARITVHAAEPIANLPEVMPTPPLVVRHYTGRFAFTGHAVVTTRRTILPDAFRYHLAETLDNPTVKRVTAHFGVLPPESRPTGTLDGDYYLLDSSYPGHFGHITTDVVARLWGWDTAKAAVPELKAVFFQAPDRWNAYEVHRQLLRAYGIADDEITVVEHPVYLRSVVGVTPMWHNQVPYYAHPGMCAVWERLGAALVDDTSPTYEKLFVSRHDAWDQRSCRNIRAVEEAFATAGFTIFYPDRHPYTTQASVFANARVLAGFCGSGLFTMMFARRLETVILLSHEGYTARNEHLFTSLLGADVHYFWSKPDVPHPPGGWTWEGFHSSWEFDFERYGGPLADILAQL